MSNIEETPVQKDHTIVKHPDSNETNEKYGKNILEIPQTDIIKDNRYKVTTPKKRQESPSDLELLEDLSSEILRVQDLRVDNNINKSFYTDV